MRAALGFALISLVACGSDSTRPSINATKDNVCDQIAQVACYDMYQCCSEGEIERDLNVTDPRTQDQCRDDVRRLCVRRLADAEASLAAGRVTFDATTMDTCLKSIVAPDSECATVTDKLPWTDACMMSAWVGTVPVGGQCFFAFDCAGDGTAYCAPNQTCTALPTPGQPCSFNQPCALGAYCDFTNDQCKALAGQGGTCTSNAQCDMDLFCDLSGGTGTGTCQPLHAGGEPCTSSQACESGVCNPGRCMKNSASCYTSANCGKYCASGPEMGFSCTSDQSCYGHCSVTTTQLCTSSATCPQTPTVETCVFDNPCVSDTCVGDVVCSSTQVTVDYCTGAVGALPLTP
ncbi:MAG: hypothetical protein ACM31C_02170 [Acidobacteriota bacterium]